MNKQKVFNSRLKVPFSFKKMTILNSMIKSKNKGKKYIQFYTSSNFFGKNDKEPIKEIQIWTRKSKG